MDDIKPLPKPVSDIKKIDVKLVKNLDDLFSEKWINEYFSPKK
tara:strand:- start:363 stop:491 length:129 start_codon:yes stop_codon:yes gene_type:complete